MQASEKPTESHFALESTKPHGGRVEYGYRRAEETQPERKVAYLLAVPGTTYVVGAGIYDPATKIDELNKLSGG